MKIGYDGKPLCAEHIRKDDPWSPICQREPGHEGRHHFSEGKSITVYERCDCPECDPERWKQKGTEAVKVWIVYKLQRASECRKFLRVFSNSESARKYVHSEFEDMIGTGTSFITEETLVYE